VWDGFYTGQIRLQKFPGLVNTKYDYEVKFVGTPPGKKFFRLDAESGSTEGSMIRIDYPKAGNIVILDSAGTKVEENDLDMTAPDPLERVQLPIQGTKCGENRYDPVNNILEFYMEANCQIYIEPRDAVQGWMRIESTMDEFFADDNAVVNFIDNICAVLGIHPSRMKVVGSYEGSVILHYIISSE